LSYPEEARPRKRRGRGLLITLLVLLLLLVIGATVVDRFGSSYAERQIAERVAAQIDAQGLTSTPPEVSIGGFPFVTQVLAGNYDDIHIVVRDLAGATEGAKSVKASVVDIHALDVRAPMDTVINRTGSIIATSVIGTATVDYASVAGLINREGLQLAEKDGKLTLTAPMDVLGRKFTVNGVADITVDKGAARIRFKDLTSPELAGIPLAENLINAAAKDVAVDVALPKLPLGLQVQKVTPQPSGLQVHASATEVSFNGAGA
jgi:hypothetical protein